MTETSTQLIREPGAAWEGVERALAARHAIVHAPAHAAWRRADGDADHWLLVINDEAGPLAAFGLRVAPARTMPGHLLVRAERVGTQHDPMRGSVVARALAKALVDLAASQGRILRITVELTERGGEALATAGVPFAAAGFTQARARNWDRTLQVDLGRDEADIAAGFSQRPRRDLKAIEKLPVEVREIHDPRWARRMEALLGITYDRTGGEAQRADWSARIALARDDARLTRLVGLFRTDRDDDTSLIAFTWGIFHGDNATYEVGASERQQDIRVPLLTPLLWDLMRWTRRNGGTWFDLGGVSPGGEHDPLAGISDFKRLFSKIEIEVGVDWVLEPHPIRSSVARAVSRLARR